MIGKNLRMLQGKPLIAWAIEQARAVKRIDRVIVSTDSIEIANAAREYGAEVPFIRPAHLAQDNTPEIFAWRHALQFIEENEGELPDIFVSVPTTAPLREADDINNCLKLFERGDVDIVLTMTPSKTNPYFNMVKMNNDGYLNVLIDTDGEVKRRQDAPIVYDLTTVAYVAEPKYILKTDNLFAGKVKGVIIPGHRALDIDYLEDLDYAELIMKRR